MSSAHPQNPADWSNAHPDFDGHLAQPIEQMTHAERLRWAWQGTLLLRWARQVRIDSGRALPEDKAGERETF